MKTQFDYDGYQVALETFEATDETSKWHCTVYVRVDEDSKTESFASLPTSDTESEALERATRAAKTNIDAKNAAKPT